VKVTGPSDKIELVNKPGFAKPHALLEIHDDDEPGKPLQREVTFNLEGLGLHVDEPHTITFSLGAD
jgi:hypothetical protein